MIYKSMIDTSSADLNSIVDKLVSLGIELCLEDDCLYLYSQHDIKPDFSIIMSNNKIRNYFIQELKNAPTKTPTNYVQAWLLEKFQEQEMGKFNEQHQAELKKAQDNIKKAQEEFLKIITDYNQTNQGGAADGK